MRGSLTRVFCAFMYISVHSVHSVFSMSLFLRISMHEDVQFVIFQSYKQATISKNRVVDFNQRICRLLQKCVWCVVFPVPCFPLCFLSFGSLWNVCVELLFIAAWLKGII